MIGLAARCAFEIGFGLMTGCDGGDSGAMKWSTLQSSLGADQQFVPEAGSTFKIHAREAFMALSKCSIAGVPSAAFHRVGRAEAVTQTSP